MERTTSRDGTPIAFDRLGAGPPVIVVGGALQGRATYHPFAAELARTHTVVNYDRRGRGDSGDGAGYEVGREVDDLAALIAVWGGRASLYGHSSGAALVLHAAVAGLPIGAIVLHDLPFGSGSAEERQAEAEEARQIAALLADGRRGDAVALFLAAMGMPAEVVDHLANDPAMLANAPTLSYDYALLSEDSRGGRTPAEQAVDAAVPALVVVGGQSPEFMRITAQQVADALPDGRLEVLDGQGHVVPPEVLVPVVTRFLAG